MRAIKVSDVVPIGEFKNQAASWLKRARSSGQPIVITQNGKPAAVLLSPSEFERIQYKEALLASIDEGIADLDAGRSIDTNELEKRLKVRLESKKAKEK